MKENSFLLYGANGYTGELIARHAALYGLTPILAGRNETALKLLADRLSLRYRVIELDDSTRLAEALKEVKVVVHAAGPFQFTAKPMIEACLNTGTHYLDINGDLMVFEMLKTYDAAARSAGIMVMPGVGFDVVPTDCLALFLKRSLPDATSLKLAFATAGGGLSHGTATTIATKLGEGGAVRKNGKITGVALGGKGMYIDFPTGAVPKNRFVMNIPWGDVSTAYFTTGIPDIEVYMGASKKAYRVLKLQPLFNWLLRTSFVRGMIKRKINKMPAGPTDEQRSKAKGYVWGQVVNTGGKSVSAGLTSPEGYTLTLHSTLIITKKVLEENFLAGYQTPSKVYGEDLVLEVPGVQRFV